MIAAQGAHAAGGCGSVCLPLDALDPHKSELRRSQYRVGVTTEHADFDNFREGDDDITNPGGNKAFISQTTIFVDYGLTEKFTASLLLPYIRKRQETNKFGTRIAEGLGDVSVFGRYKLLSPNLDRKPSITVGLGVKFPTGSISEPNSATRLPPAFQAGSGAYDIVPTISYRQSFGRYSLHSNFFTRIPLEENRRGYKFGNEYELNASIDYPIHFVIDGLSLNLGLGYLYAEHDKDSDFILPGRLRRGSKVLNTGGEFLDIVPGFTLKLGKSLNLQARVAIPVHEDWNGDRLNNVGQVAPDITTQLTLVYDGLY